MTELDQAEPTLTRFNDDLRRFEILVLLASQSFLLAGGLPYQPSELYRELCAPKLNELIGDRAAMLWEATPEWGALVRNLSAKNAADRRHAVLAGIDRYFDVVPDTDPLHQAVSRLADRGGPIEAVVMTIVLDAIRALEATVPEHDTPVVTDTDYDALTKAAGMAHLLRGTGLYRWVTTERFDDLAYHALTPALDALGRPWQDVAGWSTFGASPFVEVNFGRGHAAIVMAGVRRFVETVDLADPRHVAIDQIATYLRTTVESVICAAVLRDAWAAVSQRELQGIRKSLDLRDFVPADPTPAS